MKLRTLSLACATGAGAGLLGLAVYAGVATRLTHAALHDQERMQSLQHRAAILEVGIDHALLIAADEQALRSIRRETLELASDVSELDHPGARAAVGHLKDAAAIADELSRLLQHEDAVLKRTVQQQMRIHGVGVTDALSGVGDDLQREIRSTLVEVAVSLGLGAVLFGALCLVAFTVIHRRVGRPVAAIQRALAKLSDLSARLPVGSRDDELSRLARSFNETLDRLAESERQRREAFRSLERQRMMHVRTEAIAGVGSWEWDVDSDVVTWSRELYRLFARDPSEPPPPLADHDEIYPPEDMERLRACVAAILSTGESQVVELRAQRPDGTLRDCLGRGEAELDGDGRVVRVFGSFQDVTDWKAAQAELQRTKTRLERAQEIARLGSWEVELDSGTARWCPQACGILGVDPETFAPTEESMLALVLPEDRSAVRDARARFFAGEGPLDTVHRIRRPDGEIRWLHQRGRLLQSVGGAGRLAAGSLQDVTEQRLAEQQAERLREGLARASRLEAVGALAGGVAHDFNNNLTAILCHVEVLAAQLDPASELAEDLAHVRSAAEASSRLTGQLLAFARKQTACPEILDLNEVVNDSVPLLRTLLGENVRLEVTERADLWPVHVDRGQVEQVLTNFCVNARDAIDGAGTIRVETRNLHAIEGAEGGHVMLSVSDDGAGMDRETVDRIFEPFFTTKPDGEGTGLGLATVHGIALQNGGRVNVRSEPGRGSTFEILLPSAASRAPSSDGTPPREDAVLPSSGGESVLVVDDTDSIRRICERILVEHGYSVVAVCSPEEAVERAAGMAGVDVLVTDVVMPVMSGRRLAELVRERHPAAATLFMSGYTADIVARSGIVDEDVALLRKPFTPPAFLRRVQEILRERTAAELPVHA